MTILLTLNSEHTATNSITTVTHYLHDSDKVIISEESYHILISSVSIALPYRVYGTGIPCLRPWPGTHDDDDATHPVSQAQLRRQALGLENKRLKLQCLTYTDDPHHQCSIGQLVNRIYQATTIYFASRFLV